MTKSEYMAKLERAFACVFNPAPPPVTDEELREYHRLDARQRARDEARRRTPAQDALPLS